MTYYKNKFLIIASSITAMLLAFLNIYQAKITNQVIQIGISGRTTQLIHKCFELIFIMLVGILVSFLKKYWIGTYSIKNESALRGAIVKKLIVIDIAEYEKQNKGDYMSVLLNNLHVITQFYNANFFNLIYLPFLFIGTTVYMFIINKNLLIMSFILVPFFMFLANKISARIGKVVGEYYNVLGKTNVIINESFTMASIIKVFNLKETILNRVYRQLEENKKQGYEIEALMGFLFPVLIFIYELPGIICVIFGSWLVSKGELSVSGLIVYIQLLSYIIDPIVNFTNHFVALKKALGAWKRIKETLELTEEEDVATTLEQSDNNENVLECKNVVFRYEISQQNNLVDVSFAIKKGEMVALVGESGSGKSTILNLLCGFYQCTKGDIYLNNKNLKAYKKEDLRKKLSMAFQNSYLFTTSIYNNILYGKLDSKKDNVLKAAQSANANQFIEELSECYDEQITANGKNLSGGQRQRIGLARSFLKDSELLIMDEPTASLDAITESIIVEYIRKYVKAWGKSVIMTSHRLNTIKHADKIIVLKKGKVVGIGTHAELLKESEYYKSILVTAQND